MNRPPRTAGGSPSLERYLREIGLHRLLTMEEEREAARRFRGAGDTRAAHLLVTANLRFVVKVANEYRSFGLRTADLVQEGNLGLMKAVRRFDPERGIRLVSYAVWWIRAYVQNYILRSWSLVKLGTTQAQRRLFFSLARTRRELDRRSREHGPDSDGLDDAKVASRLHVKPAEVREMAQRLEARDLSLDAPLGDDGAHTHVDLVPGADPAPDEALSGDEERTLVSGRIGTALARLDDRERFIIEHRVMGEDPMTLRDLGAHFGFSRERARQLELRAKEKLRRELEPLALEIGWPTCATPVEEVDAALIAIRSRTS